jgi:septal ring factor EnvC (AmiA/AmiB activator)
MDTVKVNGQDRLPPAREAVIEQGNRVYQEVAHERDQLARKVAAQASDIAGYKVALEAQASQLANADSRIAEMTITRDEAVARRAEVETVLESMLAMGRAFRIGSTPLVRGAEDGQDEPVRSSPQSTGL